MKGFFDNNDEKITEKAFTSVLITSVLGILVCIVCLCSTTFAWFSDSAPSTDNKIVMAGECKLTITVADGGAELGDIENGVELLPGVDYVVTLSLPAGSSSGYCLITAGGQEYFSDYILGNSDVDQTTSFTLTVETAQTVKFTSRWGIYSSESCVDEQKRLHIG